MPLTSVERPGLASGVRRQKWVNPPSLSQIGARVAAGVAQLDAPPHVPPAGACHVWLLPLTSDAGTLAALWPLLADDERARADAFRVAWARSQFVHVRGVLRLLLGACLNLPAADIGFVYGRFGKPALACRSNLHFNVAHSGDYALLAVANGLEPGVDIERLRDSGELAFLLDRVLSPAEATQWHCLPCDERVSAFFSSWTGKEAVAKAVGQGLRLDFPAMHIGLACSPGKAGERIVVAGDFGRCGLIALPAPPGYAAALAVREAADKSRSAERSWG